MLKLSFSQNCQKKRGGEWAEEKIVPWAFAKMRTAICFGIVTGPTRMSSDPGGRPNRRMSPILCDRVRDREQFRYGEVNHFVLN